MTWTPIWAHWPEAAGLDDLEQVTLNGARRTAQLVEKERGIVRGAKASVARVLCARIRARHVTKER